MAATAQKAVRKRITPTLEERQATLAAVRHGLEMMELFRKKYFQPDDVETAKIEWDGPQKKRANEALPREAKEADARHQSVYEKIWTINIEQPLRELAQRYVLGKAKTDELVDEVREGASGKAIQYHPFERRLREKLLLNVQVAVNLEKAPKLDKEKIDGIMGHIEKRLPRVADS